jgi:hypothetical protein
MKRNIYSKAEKKAWAKANADAGTVNLTPEQTLLWLDDFRELMFEVWRKNPSLRKQKQRLDRLNLK